MSHNYKKVLIIDDDEISNFISQKLLEQCNVAEEIYSYDNAKEALAFIELCIKKGDFVPDMILLDINMPLMNGWDFLKKFEDIPGVSKHTTSLYILSSSVYSKDFDTAAKHKLVNGYIVKPLSKEKLIEISKPKKEIHSEL
jgi:two-component SAPR family response regulator